VAAVVGPSLLERRLVIVTGKGGTGKTTVAATLALAAARSGRRVLAVEVGPDEQIPGLLEPGCGPVGYAGRRLGPGIHVLRIDPFEALAEYLALQLGVRSLVDVVIRNPAFRQLMAASPGWRELITLGKIWHLAQPDPSTGTPRFDLIVVDAPATGHGVSFLEVPRVVASAVRAGPLRKQTEAVEQMIGDAEQTLVLPVALAEELPARETAQLVERVRGDMGIAIDRVVVNAVMEEPFPEAPELSDLDAVLDRLDADTAIGELPSARTLAFCTRYLLSRRRLNRHYSDEIERTAGVPIVCLPYLADGVRGPRELEVLAASLAEAL
jgi:anion-transporting  ArsA/GET3 family ATPase